MGFVCAPVLVPITIISILLQATPINGACCGIGSFTYKVGISCESCVKPPSEDRYKPIYSLCCGAMCMIGFWGHGCDEGCSSGCVNKICNRWKGDCIQGCKASFHGKSCIECPKCEYCDDEKGAIVCTCVNGYYGDLCQHTCPGNCKNLTCMSSGACRWGCIQGWVGDKCEMECTHCNGTNDSCQKGWYGRTCNQSCDGRCVSGFCYNNGSCVGGCVDGGWGEMCDVPCPETCQQNQCHLSTGTCELGCITGWYGEKCDSECPGMCHGGCRIDGSSVSCTSCKPGHYGVLCQLQCGNSLTGDCDILTGSCFSGCKDGWYGDLCNMSCPDNCKDVKGCHQDSGGCSHGCKDGWYGVKCERRCSPGCREGRCEAYNGGCVEGCIGSLYGVYCNNSCSNHCINTHCLPVEDTGTVVCIEGCNDGWRGPYCQEGEKTPFIVLSVCIIVVTICVIGILIRTRTRCLRAPSQLYLSPTGSSVAYATRTSTSLVTRWLHGDMRGDATDVTVNDDTPANNDVMSMYEPVDSGCYDTADQQSSEQYCDVHSCSSQEGIYAVIPNSHFE